MATIVEQVPGRLDIKISKGDDMSILIDFDIDITGYTHTASTVELDASTTAITVVDTDLGNGQITLTMTDTLLGAIAVGTHKWYLDRTNAGFQRRTLSGNFEVTLYNVS